MRTERLLSLAAILALAACGGGGGSSAPMTQTNPPPDGGGGTNSTVVRGGLASGGVAVVVDTGSEGVDIDVAVGGTGLTFGDIQGFGSIIANDTTVDTDTAEFIVEGASGVQADLKQGQQVLIVANDGTATSVLYRANVKGPVTSVTVDLGKAPLGRADLTVLGQTVVTDAATTFVNASVLDLAPDDLLEVSATVEADGSLRASFVERKAALAEFKLTGQVRGVTASELTIGGLTVDYSSATLADFDDGVIEDGDVVEVRAAPADFTAPGELVAAEVERLPIVTVGGDALVRVEGFIDRFESATDFDVQTTPVTTTAATSFANGDSGSLALGVKVQIDGVLNADGFVAAETVTVQRTNAVRAEGPIDAVDELARTVTVLGVEFTIRDLTRLEDDSAAELDPLTLGDLGEDERLEIRGYVDGATVVATRLEREDFEEGAALRGPVTAEDADAGTVDILGVTVTGQAVVTEFENAAEDPIDQATFHDLVELGTFVRARWDAFTATSEVADELSLEDDD